MNPCSRAWLDAALHHSGVCDRMGVHVVLSCDSRLIRSPRAATARSHIRQSRLDSGLDCQVKVRNTLGIVQSWPGIGGLIRPCCAASRSLTPTVHPLTLSPSHPLTLSPSHPHTLTPSHPHTLTSHPLTLTSLSPTLSQPPPEINNSIKMEVGIEDCLHIEFEYNRSKYHLKVPSNPPTPHCTRSLITTIGP